LNDEQWEGVCTAFNEASKKILGYKRQVNRLILSILFYVYILNCYIWSTECIHVYMLTKKSYRVTSGSEGIVTYADDSKSAEQAVKELDMVTIWLN
jgi:hypothetical protein